MFPQWALELMRPVVGAISRVFWTIAASKTFRNTAA
jgi:hypothetical protein